MLLGADPHAAGKARPRGDRGFEEKNHRGDGDHGPAIGKNRLSRRRRILLRRNSGRHHRLPLSPARPGAPGAPPFRTLVCRHILAPAVQGSGRGGTADLVRKFDLSRHPEVAAKRPSKDAARSLWPLALRGSLRSPLRVTEYDHSSALAFV